MFLRLLFMLVVPLFFAALVIGVSELDVRQLGRVGAKTLVDTAFLSSIAVLIRLVPVNLIGPRRGATAGLRALAASSSIPAAAQAPRAVRSGSSWGSSPTARSRPQRMAT